ncbi:ABC transporter permease [Cytobacillus depressus]|uniref:ABC transporter permease n=1 Tax=Cytobacillus depressus TaxID=1602942 RepID=A0A6L3V3H6_9BACI|nr:ABC transporter permease [Cytobacillus depressus]KAB2332067.1 ABC transporter permease [Cytobacillus depressus]
MNFIKRALLSVKARKGKSLLQIFIFTVICVLVLSGLAIQTAANKSADSARKSLGGDVTLQVDMEKMMEKMRSEGGRVRMQRTPIPVAAAEELTTYPDVKGFNFYSSAMGTASDFTPIKNEEDTEAEDVGKNGQAMNGGFTVRGSAMGDISLQGVLYSDSVQEFMDSKSKVIEGRHLTDSDTDKSVAMVEKTLAEENDLKVGDHITIQSSNNENTYTFEIVGIYETTSTGDDMGMSFAALNPVNKIYVPYTAVNKMKGDEFAGTIDSAVYYINDPANIDQFIDTAQKDSSIDFETFKLDANDAVYKQMVGPLENVASFSKNVVYLVTIAGAIILGLIVMMSIRERKYEMGVLLALGEKKWKMIGQFIVEILVVAILALGISAVSGKVVANQVGEQLLTQQLQMEETNAQPQSFMGPRAGGMGMRMGQPVQHVDPIDELSVNITSEDLGMLTIIGLLIAILSALLPSLSVLRLQPKTILTKQD